MSLSPALQKFADLWLMRGWTVSNCYVQAGLSKKGDSAATIRKAAMKAFNRQDVQQYIETVRASAYNEKRIADLTELDERLTEITRVNVLDILDIVEVEAPIGKDDDGNTIFGKTHQIALKEGLSVAQTAAVTGVKMGKYGLEFSLEDRSKAREMLIKRQGGFKEVVEHQGNGQVVYVNLGDNGRGPKKD